MRSTQPTSRPARPASPVSSRTSRTTASARGSPRSTRPPGTLHRPDPRAPPPPHEQEPAVVDDDGADADLGRAAPGHGRRAPGNDGELPGRHARPLVEVLAWRSPGRARPSMPVQPAARAHAAAASMSASPDPDVASVGLDEDERDAGDRRPVGDLPPIEQEHAEGVVVEAAHERAGGRIGAAAAAGWLPAEGAAPTPAARARRPVGPPSRRCRRRPGRRASGGRPRPRVGPSPPRDHVRRSWLILERTVRRARWACS